MPVPIHFPPPGFDDLSIDAKIDYLELLWERIATSPEPVVVPEWHREVISERLRDIESDPNSGDKWEVVQKRPRAEFSDITVSSAGRADPVRRPQIASELAFPVSRFLVLGHSWIGVRTAASAADAALPLPSVTGPPLDQAARVIPRQESGSDARAVVPE
jgi:putative addiction module component (TIGR02574 family)